MILCKPAYFERNKRWYYFDIRNFRLKLTDKATPKAINSYIDNYCLLEGMPVNANYDELKKEIRERTMQDIKDFKENKLRYTFEIDEKGNQILSKIDGVFIL